MGVDEVVARARRRERQHAARAADAGAAPRCRCASPASRATTAGYAHDGDRRPRRPSRSASATSPTVVDTRRGAALARARQRRAGGRHRHHQADQGQHRRRRRRGARGGRGAAAELPPGIEIQVVRDTSVFIRESVADVQEHAGARRPADRSCIVFCFLNSWRSTVITGLTLPISVISSFIVMYFLGHDAEHADADGAVARDRPADRRRDRRAREHRPPPRARAGPLHRGARRAPAEIGLAVLATSMSIIAVFVPVAFMKGIIGRFFFQFGLTVAFAVLVSLFVSFTLDPMLSSRWYDPDIERKGRRNLLHARARPLQRLVRADGRRLQGASSAGRSTTARPCVGAGARGVRRRPRRLRHCCRPSS